MAMWHPAPAVRSAVVHQCVTRDCGRLALQRCVRCERSFCNEHIYPVERDLPTRGLQIPQPYWYCSDCLPRYR